MSCKDYIFVRGDDLDLSWDGALTGWDGSLLPNPPTQPSDHVMAGPRITSRGRFFSIRIAPFLVPNPPLLLIRECPLNLNRSHSMYII